MRLVGRNKNQPLIILVDGGSIHKFIDHNTVKKLHCPTYILHGLHVSVAIDDVLRAREGCKGVE